MPLRLRLKKKCTALRKLNFVPRANAMASYGWNDPEFMGFGADNYVVGIQLSWDLFGGYKNIGKIHKEKALLEQAELEQQKYLDQSEMELNKASACDLSHKAGWPGRIGGGTIQGGPAGHHEQV